MLFKSTRGLPASLLGGVIGMGMIATLQKTTNELRKKGIIKMEMKFDD